MTQFYSAITFPGRLLISSVLLIAFLLLSAASAAGVEKTRSYKIKAWALGDYSLLATNQTITEVTDTSQEGAALIDDGVTKPLRPHPRPPPHHQIDSERWNSDSSPTCGSNRSSGINHPPGDTEMCFMSVRGSQKQLIFMPQKGKCELMIQHDSLSLTDDRCAARSPAEGSCRLAF